MLRIVALPFAILLVFVCLGLIAGGVALLGESGAEGGERRDAALLDIAAFSEEERAESPAAAIAGASMLGFGVLGAIGAVALLIMSLSGDRAKPAPSPPAQQQQQQQVVVVKDPDARVEVERR